VFEEENAQRLARVAARTGARTQYGQGLRPLEAWSRVEQDAVSPHNYVCGGGCDARRRYRDDIALAAALGLQAYRFTVSWAALEPKPGRIDTDTLAYYIDVIRQCRRHGLEPFVGLWHFAHPWWFEERGGWSGKGKWPVARFVSFARRVAEALRGEARFFLPLNEPEMYAIMSYLAGAWPPERISVRLCLRVLRNLAAAHRGAYRVIKRLDASAQVGSALHTMYFDARDALSRPLAGLLDRWLNDWFLAWIAGRSDFLGVNYYQHVAIRNLVPFRDLGLPRSDLGWQLSPLGLYEVLMRRRGLGLPVFVTEYGLADAQDRHREWYLREGLRMAAAAICAGVDVRGLFVWSLLDNFEWRFGWWPRFGLIEVDRLTGERRVRESAWEMAPLLGTPSAGSNPRSDM
jgi:beta-glucosidase